MTTETIEKEEIETTEVDVIQTLIALPPKKTVLDVFVNKENEAQLIIDQIKSHYKGLDDDLSTDNKRKTFKAEIKKIKTANSRLTEMRKEETRRLKELPNQMVATNNWIEAQLNAFYEELYKPLAKIEAEEKRIADEKKAKKKAEELAKQIELDHREALIMNAEFDMEREKARIKAEQEKKEANEKLQRELEEKAKAEAEYQAQLAIQQAKNAELEAIRAKEQAEKEKAEALAKAEEEKQAEIARINAENEAKEKARLDAEAKAKAEEEARKANIEHQRTINRAIIAKLEELGLDSEIATVVLKAMAKREIPNVTINY
ncbi:hypothetical protein [Thorsellia kenyensis]|uniref:Uncharacterized protein n=1 Tax=Thorsellia kenyensis TaxID=1549888 RepID=A0ABV6C901_9GAMM